MLACETLPGVRIISEPALLDRLTDALDNRPLVWRFAPDDAFIATFAAESGAALPDEHAIIADDHGWSRIAVNDREFADHVAPYVEWPPPTEPLQLAQGNIAFVPAKLRRNADRDGYEILVQTAFAHDLLERLV